MSLRKRIILPLIAILAILVWSFFRIQTSVDITRDIDLENLPAGTRQMVELLQGTISEGNIGTQPFLMQEKLGILRFFKRYISWIQPDWKRKAHKMNAEAFMMAGNTEAAVNEIHLLLNEMGITQNSVTHENLEFVNFLAIAGLRKGEQENCLLHHNSKSCTVPFEKEAFHVNKEGAMTAVKYLTKILEDNPEDHGSTWLLNIAYMALGLYPDQVPVQWLITLPDDYSNSPGVFSKFDNIAGKLGVDVNKVSGGTIIDDFNNDGLLDIVASSYGITDQLRYFENNGKGFIDQTIPAGLSGLVGGLNIMQTDFNNDGLLDIFVLRGGWFGAQGNYPNSLLMNLGNGKFEDVTIAAELLSLYPTQTACWADFNKDGWLDVFIGNEVANEEKYLDDPDSDSTNAYPCELYLNNGDGTFTNVAKHLGLEINEYVKGSTWTDYNNDGLPDLFVSILGRENKLFRNDGGSNMHDWKFTDVSKVAGISGPVFSFPVWSFDYNNDGWEDLFVADYNDDVSRVADEFAAEMLDISTDAEHLCLYKNNGDGTFSNYTDSLDLEVILYAMGCNYGDLDNDGYQDFYIGTGAPSYEAIIPNRMFRNNQGETFAEVTFSGGFGIIQKGHGVSFADIDNDGDQDIYIVMGGAYEGDNFPNALFENPGNDNAWITIKLIGEKSNRAAIGAKLKLIIVDDSEERIINRVISSGGSFGANPLQSHIGLGKATMIKELIVTWPEANQLQERFTDVKVNRFITIRENSNIIVDAERSVVNFNEIPAKGHNHNM